MKKKDIIQLVKKIVKEDAYGSATLTTQGPPRTGAIAPTDEYPFSKRPKRTATGMMESQDTLSSDMLNYADQYHMELVDTMKGVSTYPDKRTGGFYIRFPHYNGPNYTGALFGKDVSDKIDASKAAAKAAALKTVKGFKTEIEDYSITDKSRAGVYGSIHLWIMPKTMDESPMFKTDVKQDMAPKEMAGRIKSVFDKVNGAQHPVQTPEWHKNRFKNKYGISFPENIKNINKDQALAMNKYANDMKIREADLKNIKEDISDEISKAEDEVQKATQAKADAEVKVAAARKKKADGEKGALEEVEDFEGKVADPTSMSNADIGALQVVVSDYSLNKVLNTIAVIADKTGKHDEADMIQKLANQIQDFDQGEIDSPGASAYTVDMGPGAPTTMENMMESYIKERGDSNLMEHIDKYRKRALLMEGATEKLFAMFNDGKTNDDVIHHYSLQRIEMPDSFVSKLRKNWEDMRKTKLELTLADKEAEGFNQTAAQSSQEVGMEGGMEEKQLTSGLTNEELDPVGKEDKTPQAINKQKKK
jgi:hypothetical protein